MRAAAETACMAARDQRRLVLPGLRVSLSRPAHDRSVIRSDLTSIIKETPGRNERHAARPPARHLLREIENGDDAEGLTWNYYRLMPQ